jgi:hypothetical protein
MSASPQRPAQPVAEIADRPDDQGREQVLDLVAGQWDKLGRWRPPGPLGQGGHDQKGLTPTSQVTIYGGRGKAATERAATPQPA